MANEEQIDRPDQYLKTDKEIRNWMYPLFDMGVSTHEADDALNSLCGCGHPMMKHTLKISYKGDMDGLNALGDTVDIVDCRSCTKCTHYHEDNLQWLMANKG